MNLKFYNKTLKAVEYMTTKNLLLDELRSATNAAQAKQENERQEQLKHKEFKNRELEREFCAIIMDETRKTFEKLRTSASNGYSNRNVVHHSKNEIIHGFTTKCQLMKSFVTETNRLKYFPIELKYGEYIKEEDMCEQYFDWSQPKFNNI